MFVDKRDMALEEAGDIIIPMKEGRIGPDHIAAEIGEVASGKKAGRLTAEEVTFFKTVGVAAQDIVLASQALLTLSGYPVPISRRFLFTLTSTPGVIYHSYMGEGRKLAQERVSRRHSRKRNSNNFEVENPDKQLLDWGTDGPAAIKITYADPGANILIK